MPSTGKGLEMLMGGICVGTGLICERGSWRGCGCRAILLTFVLALAVADFASPVRAEDARPIWTLVPTHIDRSTDTRVRIETVPKRDETITISVDRPVRIGPDGSFGVDGKPMRIFGLDVPDRQRLCQTSEGGRWACGLRANAFFNMLLTRGPLVCTPRSPPDAYMTIADCRSGTDDVARRMLGDGWAAADLLADNDLKMLADAARAAKRGLWRDTVPEF